MNRLIFGSVSVLFVLGLWACGDSNQQRNSNHSSPQRLGDVASYGAEWGNLPNPTSLVSYKAVVYLDRVAAAGQVAFNAGCFDTLQDDFELGIAICDAQQSLQVPILAKNVEQRCLADLSRENVPAQEVIGGVECAQWNLVAHAFNPPLRFAVRLNQ
jgi:hypothetical protein